MTTDVDALITKLDAHLVRLLDGRDRRPDRDQAEHTLSIRRTISALKDLPSDVEKRSAQIAELHRRRNVIVEKQTALEQALLDAEIPREQQNIRLQLQLLRTGGLFLSPGDVAEPLEHLDRRIADFTARRDRAQAGLDAYVRQAKEVLGESVVTTS